MTTTAKQPTTRRAPNLPAVMRAVVIDRFGPPDVMTVRNVPVPQPGPREVLVELYGAGVGIWDAKRRDGTWAEGGERFPLVLGADGAGVVVARGTGVEQPKLYDEVWAYEYANPKGGFYAEYVAVHTDNVGHKPERLTALEAAAAACPGLTALQGIDDHLDVRQGECVLVFGASGSLGTLAVQFAKRRMAKVIGTASGPAATTLVRELGADHVFDARADDAVQKLRTFAPDGLDAVLALAGGRALERCLDLVRAGGRVAYPNGVEPEPTERPAVRLIPYDAEADPRRWAELERATDEARLRVPIAGVHPLDKAAEAHARLERGHVVGRLVLKIRDEPQKGPVSQPD